MLVVHPHFHRRRTGVTRHVEELVRAAPDALDVRVLELAPLGRVVARALPRIGWGEIRAAARGAGLVWHAHRNLEAAVGLALRARHRRVRVIFTRHAAGRPGVVTRWLQRRADVVVALTPAVAAELDRPAAVVGHGVDVTRFTPPPDRGAAWAALGVGGGQGIGVIGRLRPAKGQGDLVTAFRSLEAPDWRVVLVGAAKGRDAAWARSLAGPRVALVGEQADVGPWYQGCSIVVQPSHTEGFGLVLLEAMASGCCVVATRTGGAEALITHGETGFLYPPGDHVALRRILAALLGDGDGVAAVGRAARAAVVARHGVVAEAAALARLYTAALPAGVHR